MHVQGMMRATTNTTTSVGVACLWAHLMLGLVNCTSDSDVVSLDFVDKLMDETDMESIAACGVSEMDLRNVAMAMERAVIKLGETDFTDVPKHWGASCNDIYGFMQSRGDIITNQASLIRDIRRFFPRAYPEFRARLEKRLVYYNELIGILKHKHSRTGSSLENGFQKRLTELHFFTNRFYSEATAPKPSNLNPTTACGVSLEEQEELREIVRHGTEQYGIYTIFPESWEQSCTSILRFLEIAVQEFLEDVQTFRSMSDEEDNTDQVYVERIDEHDLDKKMNFIETLIYTLKHSQKEIKTRVENDFQDKLTHMQITMHAIYD